MLIPNLDTKMFHHITVFFLVLHFERNYDLLELFYCLFVRRNVIMFY
jgi:hypothetical protein